LLLPSCIDPSRKGNIFSFSLRGNILLLLFLFRFLVVLARGDDGPRSPRIPLKKEPMRDSCFSPSAVIGRPAVLMVLPEEEEVVLKRFSNARSLSRSASVSLSLSLSDALSSLSLLLS